MNRKTILRRCIKLAEEHFVFIASVCILTLGGLPLLFYAIHIDQLPDFSLTDLTGTLIASFFTEVFLGSALALYFLLPSTFARRALRRRYPLAIYWSKPDPARIVEQLAQSGSVDYLMNSGFIVGTTVITLYIWGGVAALTFGKSAPDLPFPGRLAYWCGLGSSALLTAVDWRGTHNRSKFKYCLRALSILSVIALVGSLLAWQPIRSAIASHDVPAPLRNVVQRALSIESPFTAHWPHLAAIWGYVIAALAGASIMLTVIRYRLRLSAGIAYAYTSIRHVLSSRDARKLLAVKAEATGRFAVCMAFPLLFLLIISDTGDADGKIRATAYGFALLTLLNWWNFTAQKLWWRPVIGIVTLGCMLLLVPLLANNPSFYSTVIVRTLGFGNLHATSVTLSAEQCATLRPYGIDCEAKKDESITLANVNVLNRLGNTVILELLVHPTDSCEIKAGAERKLLDSDEHAAIRLRDLTMCPGFSAPDVNVSKCDTLLLQARAKRAVNGTDPLTCVRISLPKDQLLAFSSDGARVYDATYSRYVEAIKRKKPTPQPTPKPHPHPRPAPHPCDCLTRSSTPTLAN